MAIINCPHFGQSVSDKAESCVHCGEKLIIESAPPEDQQPEESVDYIKEFNAAAPEVKQRKEKFKSFFKFYDKFEILFFTLIYGLFALVYLIIVKTDLAKSYGGGVCICLVILTIAMTPVVLKFIKYHILSHLYSVQCSNWIKQNNIDATRFIQEKFCRCLAKNDLSEITDDDNDFYDFAKGTLFANDEKAYPKFKAHLIVNAVVVMTLALWVAFVVPFLFPAMIMRWPSSQAITYLLIMVIPISSLFILRIVLHFALTKQDMKRISDLYLSEEAVLTAQQAVMR